MDDSRGDALSQGDPEALAEHAAIQDEGTGSEQWASPARVHLSIFPDVHARSLKVWTPAWPDLVERIKNSKVSKESGYATRHDGDARSRAHRRRVVAA
jgi:hypothetical protein